MMQLHNEISPPVNNSVNRRRVKPHFKLTPQERIALAAWRAELKRRIAAERNVDQVKRLIESVGR